MKRVIDSLMTFLVFFGAWKLFPEYVCCKDLRTLIISVIVLYIILTIIGITIIVPATFLLDTNINTIICIIILIIAVIFGSFGSLFMTTVLVPGFSINGIVTYILLIVVTVALTPSSESE